MSRIFNKPPRNLLLAFAVFAFLFLFLSLFVSNGFAFGLVRLINGFHLMLKRILLLMGHNHSLVVSIALLHILNLFGYECMLNLNRPYPMALPSAFSIDYTASEVFHFESFGNLIKCFGVTEVKSARYSQRLMKQIYYFLFRRNIKID